MKILINADDFGLSPGKNEAIDLGMRQGFLHRTSLIVNSAYAEQASVLAKLGGYADRVCFHLNLAEGMAMSKELQETDLVGENGQLKSLRNRELLLKGFSSARVNALRAECAAQMKRFRELGFFSRHIDSHKWSMCSIPTWTAIEPLLQDFGFESTRTLEGHRLSTCGSAMRLSYRLVFGKMKKSYA